MSPRSALWAALCLLAAGSAFAGPPMSSGTNSVARDATSDGGGRSATASNALDATAGEEAVSAPGAATASNRLAAGFGEIYAFPGTVVDLAVQPGVAVSSAALAWSAPGYNGELGSLKAGSSYHVQWSSDPAAVWSPASAQVVMSTSGVNPGDAQGLPMPSLFPNTTTFFRLWTFDADGDASFVSNAATATTLAPALSFSASPFPMVGVSSVSAGWGALPGSPSSTTAEGYLLQASTAPDFSGTLFSFATASVAASTLTVTGLASSTLYYFRVGALNWQGTANFAALGSQTTLAPPPPSYPVYSSPQVSTNAATGPWIGVAGWVSSTTVDARLGVQNTVSGLLVSTTQPAGLAAQWHFDESSGSYALDASGNGDVGTIVGGSSWTAGQYGQALYLNGTSNEVDTPFVQNAVTAYTVEMWVKTTDAGTERAFVQDRGSGAGQSLTFGMGTSGGGHGSAGSVSFELDSNGTDIGVSSVLTIDDGAWHHIAGVWSAPSGTPVSTSQFAIYIDGSPATVTAGSVGSVSSPLTGLGGVKLGRHDAWGTNLNGTIDEVRIYTTALTAAQIASDYASDTLAAQNQGAAYSVLYSSTTGAAWAYAPVSSVTLTGVNGTTALQTFQVNGLPLAVSTGTNSTVDQVEFVSQSAGGSVTEAKYVVQVDTVAPLVPSFSPLTSATTYGMTLSGLSGSDALSGLAAAPFDVQASSDPLFVEVDADAGWIAGPGFVFSTLAPNTTYYARADAQDAAGNVSLFASTKSLSTLATAPAGVGFLGFSASTANVSWNALPVSPSSSSSEGYELDASSTNFGALLPGGLVSSSVTARVQASTLTAFGLVANTTYYFRVASLDWSGATNYIGISSASSLANLPVKPATAAVYASSVTVSWTLPALGDEGFVLQASTDPAFNGFVTSSATAAGAATSLSVLSLFSATTYYFRVGSLNWSGSPDYAAAGSTVTPPSVDVTPPIPVTDLSASTDTPLTALLSWNAPSDPDNNPLNGTYAIQYATWTGVTYATSSAQVLISTSGLIPGAAQGTIVPGLSPNTTYFFGLWTSDVKPNWSGLSNGATVATLAQPLSGAQLLSLSSTTAQAGWGALPATPSSATAEGYRLEASSTDFGGLAPGGLVDSSTTANLSASTLTAAGLNSNTTYYYRVASLNWAGAPEYAAAGSASTLAAPPKTVLPVFLDIFPSSLTVDWAALPASPSSATSEGYELDASSTDFGALSPGGLVYSSSTLVNAASALTVSGLDSNTTYYLRVGALDWSGAPDYTVLAATSTDIQTPALLAPAFTAAGLSDLSAQWDRGADAVGSFYRLDLSTASDFTGTLFSSATFNLFADVPGLAVNTLYYGRVSATGNSGRRSPFLLLGSTSTLASQPLA
ncbi:MAG TPA: LamG-like jellyroll fold domain-containing protein, partial [Elusimicrobiota bacterium]|nr:LamG-like jellyroll fold domain-containing protein [Elusimicrobiota bacterium]